MHAPSAVALRSHAPAPHAARRLNELLHSAGIQPDSLPASCRDSLATLARMANELDMVVVSENRLAAAWGSLSVEDMKAARMQVRDNGREIYSVKCAGLCTTCVVLLSKGHSCSVNLCLPGPSPTVFPFHAFSPAPDRCCCSTSSRT